MRHYLLLILSFPTFLVMFAFTPGQAPAPLAVVPYSESFLASQLQAQAKQTQYDEAEETAARVLRSHCGSDEWAEFAGHNAVDFRVPPRIVAALIVVESTCRAGIVSSEGAIGLMQVVPRVWHIRADQLRDPEFNIRKGTEILASYTRAHGLREGLHRYNGLGVGCDACDGEYPDKVLLVAGYRR